MSQVTSASVVVTTASDGSATAYIGTNAPLTGRIVTLRYVKTDFADGSSFTITSENTGETIWSESSVNASATRAPRQATHTTTGAASLYAAGGTAVNDRIALANDRIKIVIASGGNVKSGQFIAVLD